MAALIRSDLEFILQQIKAAESGTQPTDPLLPYGLRTVDGSNNNLIEAQTSFGAADQVFPRMTDPVFRTAEDGTSFAQSTGDVIDSQPRTISNLIVDQTSANPAAVAAAGGATPTADGTLFIPNAAPDGGASAPFNSWLTLFGQFFDHGLDLVNKGGNGTVFIPLKPDDPLYVEGSPTNFMVLTRATNLPGPDGVVGTADDIHEQVNQTTPFVDQNQTYTSHPSHQVFLREYAFDANGLPQSTGRLLENRDAGSDGEYFTSDDVPLGGLATWAVVKANAATFLGIELTDADATDLPLLATDAYGQFLRGPNGFAQVVVTGNTLVEGSGSAPISTADAVRTGHAFLNDIANSAAPRDADGVMLAADVDTTAGADDGLTSTYDDELLDAHYATGDGRGNENIGLTAVHVVFHAEHNGLVDQIKDVVLATNDAAFLSQWLVDGTAPAEFPATPEDVSALQWDGERLFQAARFSTEMQYQHLVFEEFARRVQPDIDEFAAYNSEINPAIVAEFAHTVYRFGHSMLTDTVARTNPDGTPNDIGLIEAFINPLAFAESGPTQTEAAGAIVRGMTNQVGNEIDEFVTDALRNNLLGLPLDLASINIARGRDAGIPSLNAARKEFFQGTGDAALEPYENWVDFGKGITHPESLVNFIAAYGTHSTIVNAATLEEKRAAASLIVLGGDGAPTDRLDFLNGTGAWAHDANGMASTGLDDVDLWIGGLAEKKMSDGGLLGSTFAFVFETQLENLQNGDRFYYLSRTAGLNFFNQLEDSSFAEMIMRNTDATHLPFDVFSTPEFTIEASDWSTWPDGLVTTIREGIQFNGDQHVVLGGTAGNDNLQSGSGDDTIWGDDGNDALAGGAGNDAVMGGAGNDVISDRSGDDVLRGGDGDDTIRSGPGADLLLGGAGDDLIEGGVDEVAKEVFGGLGNDIVLSGNGPDEVLGNEGDDWIDGGPMDDVLIGDNEDPQGLSTIIAHDVLIGGPGTNQLDGENGDDIFVSGRGSNQNFGRQGFDWVSLADSETGVTADLTSDADSSGADAAGTAPGARVTASNTFAEVEALSGSPFNDVLRGDDTSDNAPPTPGLIKGLDALLAGTSGGGNVILGGRGSDMIEGRGGDDFIDGDASLTVSLTDTAAGGEINREISSSPFNAPDVDTAVFSDIQANYTVTLDERGIVTVAHLNGAGADGTDTLRHIEQLQFSDTTVLVDGGKGGNGWLPKPGASNNLPTGSTAHDTFVFNKPSENDDSVADLAQGSDVAGLGGKPDENAPATVTTPTTIASVLSRDATGISTFDNSGANAGVLDANGEGDDDPVTLLQPQGPTSLVPTDFHVV